MFDCFKILNKPVGETYPTVVYVTWYTNTSGCFTLYGGVYESEEDAKQYCIDHTTDTVVYKYYSAVFKPPGSTVESNVEASKGPNYPNYMYPIISKESTVKCYSPQPPYAFANENDASDFCALHNSSTILVVYSIQNYFPEGTYDLKKKPLRYSIFDHPIVIPRDIISINTPKNG